MITSIHKNRNLIFTNQIIMNSDLLSLVWEDLDGGMLLDKKQYLSEGE